MSIAKEAYNAGAAQNGSLGIGTDGAAPCIRGDEHPSAIARRLDMTHADEVIREVDGGAAPTLQSRMGTGGNQVPLVLMVSRGDVRDRIAEICAGLDEWPEDEWYSVVPGLNLNVFIDMDGKRRATAFLVGDEKLENGVDIEYVGDGTVGSTVAVGVDAYNQSTTGGASKPLGHSATDTDHTPAVILHHIVRRLTPVECSRLQGFPDYWCRIPMGKWRKIDRGEYEYLASHGDWHRSHIRETDKPGVWETDLATDSPIYRAMGNSWATNCAEWILRRIVAAFRLDMIPDNN